MARFSIDFRKGFQMHKGLILGGALFFVSSFGYSQEQTTTASVETTSTSKVEVPAEASASTIKPILSFKSTNDSGRLYQIVDPRGQTSRDKQELTFGLKTKAGWGASVTGVENAATFNYEETSRQNGISQGDHFVTVLHPNFYSNSSTNSKVTGQMRFYFPSSERSKKYDQRQYAYYLGYETQLDPQWSLTNTAIPRLFERNVGVTAGTKGLSKIYFEDKTTLFYKYSKNIKYHLSQWTQVDRHVNNEDAVSVELIPGMDYSFNEHFMVGPRIQLPLYADGLVNNGPTAVSTDNTLFELQLEVRL